MDTMSAELGPTCGEGVPRQAGLPRPTRSGAQEWWPRKVRAGWGQRGPQGPEESGRKGRGSWAGEGRPGGRAPCGQLQEPQASSLAPPAPASPPRARWSGGKENAPVRCAQAHCNILGGRHAQGWGPGSRLTCCWSDWHPGAGWVTARS